MRWFGAVLVVVSLLSVVASPAEAAQKCGGETATLVGRAGEDLRGTSGDDVIVSNGASSVTALGGDDLVCVTGTFQTPGIADGSGDDVIDASRAGAAVAVNLGRGDDTVIGSAHPDYVELGSRGQDQVRTAGGNDSVNAYGAGDRRADEISLGAGYDHAYVGGRTRLSKLNGGPGADELVVRGRGSAWTVDARAGTAGPDGRERLRFRSFSRFNLNQLRVRSLTFQGSSRPEILDVLSNVRTSLFARMRGGDDILGFRPVGRPVRASGGPGRDLLDVSGSDADAGFVSVAVDLGDALVEAAGATYSTPGFDDVRTYRFPSVSLRGTDAGNRLFAFGACQVSLVGLGGDDLLELEENYCAQDADYGDASTRVLDGGAGDDTLRGSPQFDGGAVTYPDADDTLIGGLGVDSADGSVGEDACDAETEVSCESDPT